MDVIIREVGVLVKYPHIGKSCVLSDEEFLRRRIDVKMTSIYSSDRDDEFLEDLMANVKRRAFSDAMTALLPEELIYLKINYKPGRGDDEFFGFETNRDIPGNLDVAYYMHRDWRRQFYDSTRKDLYYNYKEEDRWTWGYSDGGVVS